MSVNSYRELVVWQKSMDLVEKIYILVKSLPKEELYSLSDQMKRAVVSIPSNIAEGQQRNSTKEFAKFLSIAKGSNAELQTQLMICVRLKYLTQSQAEAAMLSSEEVGKMLTVLIGKLSTVH
ncbi:MAG: four helix bundle protein [Clostridiales bacterium]|nr:four helix bundle protein [Clostridiales bacterium]